MGINLTFSYSTYDALGLASLVKAREISPRELVEAAFARLDEVNPVINAVVRTRREAALREADEMPVQDNTRPFAGVPFLLKDISQSIAGEPITCGAMLMKNNVARWDSNYVARIRKAGFIPLGHTNTPEFGLKTLQRMSSMDLLVILGISNILLEVRVAEPRQLLLLVSFQ